MSTTLRVSRETKSKLERFGRKGQSFDDIINSLIHQRNILAIHEICKDMETDSFTKSTVMQVFDYIGYEIPLTYTEYENGQPYKCDWVTEERAIKWAMEMARDEDFIGAYRENVPVSELITNTYCLLEEIPAPTWSMSLRFKNPFDRL